MKPSLKKWLDSLAIKGFPDEFEAKRLLNLYKIATPKACRLHPDDNLGRLEFNPPFVLKVCSGNILHKTEQDGVMLNLDNESLPKAVAHFRARFPNSALLIEEQVAFKGVEFIIGALVDPDFGPAVMAGAGGILTEIYKDVVFRLAPCPPEEALRMLQELIVAPVLKDFRGIHIDARELAGIISKTSDLVFELGSSVCQLDINPLVFSRSSWIALDAKLVLNG
ncbi:MAG: acetate--CoA ligase family protein [Desulfobacterales bacterium]|nr:MAG: acetate--CoA ligase family protein [Desulfobacterales bacterium]